MLKLIKNIVLLSPLRVRRICDDSKIIKCGFYSKNVEEKINEQIAFELNAAYTYLSIQFHFARSDVALKGCEEFFKRSAIEEQQHAIKLCKYQNFRGGTIRLLTIENPMKCCYSVSDAFVWTLHLEKDLTQKLIELKKTARNCKTLLNFLSISSKVPFLGDDDVTEDFIVTEFLKSQVNYNQNFNFQKLQETFNFQFKAIQTLDNLITRLDLLNDSDIGVVLFDKELQERLKNKKDLLH